jgi:hypothetical protein
MTPLYRAVLARDLAEVRKQLAGGADVNARNSDNRWTVLMVAVGEGFSDVVAELLTSPAIDVNARAERDLTALHVATERGDQRAVELLLAHPGVDVNVKDNLGRTPLIIAAFAGPTARRGCSPIRARGQRRRPRPADRAHVGCLGGTPGRQALLADPRTNWHHESRTSAPPLRSRRPPVTMQRRTVAPAVAADPGDDRLARATTTSPDRERAKSLTRRDPPNP